MSLPSDQTISILKRTNAFLPNGHYVLKGGQHSSSYLQCRLALMYRNYRSRLSRKLACLFSEEKIEAVAGFTISGILLARELSKLFNWKLVVGEEREDKTVSFVKNSILPKGSVLLVDDVLTTGESIEQALKALEEVNVHSVGFLVDRSCEKVNFKVPYKTVTRIDLDLYDEDKCPMCKRLEPYVDLSHPETNPLSVLLSLPTEIWKVAIKGFKDVYTLQNKSVMLGSLARIEATLPLVEHGLPTTKVDEVIRLTQFIDEILRPRLVQIGISDEALSNIIGHLLTLVNICQESRALGCTMIIGEIESIEDLLPVPSIVVKPPERINHRNLRKLIPLYDLHDEKSYAFIFDKEGEFKEIRRLMTQITEVQGLRLAQSLTSDSKSVTLIVRKGEKSLRVYVDGRLDFGALMSEKSGVWEFKSYVSVMEKLSSYGNLPTRTILNVLDVCIELTQRGFGAIFIVGNDSKIHGFSKTTPKLLTSIDMDTIVDIAKQDGATIISNDGKILGFSYIIGLGRSVSQETRGHARHAAGLNASLQNPDSLVFVVSQNKTITVYRNGKKIEEI